MKPFVTVVTATRNRFDLVKEALASIAAQDFRDYEALLIDDGSDASVQEQYEDLFRTLPSNFKKHQARTAGSTGSGPAAARNLGIKLAQGEYVAFLDDDDRWIRPDHLAVAADALKSRGSDFFFTNIQGVRDERVVLTSWFPNLPQLESGSLVAGHADVRELSQKTISLVASRQGAHPDAWVVRKSLLEQLNGFWSMGTPSEDYELFTRLLDRSNGVLYRTVPTVSYRLPAPDSVSARFSLLEEQLQIATNARHIRACCVHRWTIKSARAQESWALRRIALLMISEGRLFAARSFAWQALLTYPTLGAAALMARTLVSPGRPPAR